MEASAPADEIRASLTNDDRRALPVALATLRAQTQPAREDRAVMEDVAIALGRQIGLIRPNLSVEQKDEWISIALDDLVGFPAWMLLEALPIVRRSVTFEGEVIPAVLAIVEPKAMKLQRELRNVETLAEIAA